MTDEDGDGPPEKSDAGADKRVSGEGSREETTVEREPDAETTKTAQREADAKTGAESDGEPDIARFHRVVEASGSPVVTTGEVARHLGVERAAAESMLSRLDRDGAVSGRGVEHDPTVWYPVEWDAYADSERCVVFPRRRQLVVDQPAQFTRAQLSQFARLADTNRQGGYIYEIRPPDVWGAPYDTAGDLLRTVRDVLPQRYPELEEWVREQFERATQFRLYTHEDGYTVLEAGTAEVMADVARGKLDDGQLRATISETESWVADESTAEIKRVLYEAGYPVRDERALESGARLDVELDVELREYQRDWVERFLEAGSGVLVGPPGSGKTVAALAILAEIGGETLVLVPSRELARQWRDELLARTSLEESQVGEYHGGAKEIRPVTVATYQTAGMDRHRQLFDSREWGLIVYDEVQHVPSEVYRRSTDLQSRHRLGISASPIREDDREEDIFTLVGRPIGTDWDALFDEGYVAEPRVEIRYVPWTDDDSRDQYVGSDGHERRQRAASNPAKIGEIEHLLSRHPAGKALVFVDYLDQGREIAAALDAPFVSGETRHHRREKLFERFREGSLQTLVVSRVGDEGIDLPDAEVAIVASGLGGSRRQGTQRAGRTMRPAGRALMYVLATRGTREEEFARRQMHHLAEKGVQVTERQSEVRAPER